MGGKPAAGASHKLVSTTNNFTKYEFYVSDAAEWVILLAGNPMVLRSSPSVMARNFMP